MTMQLILVRHGLTEFTAAAVREAAAAVREAAAA